MSRRLPAPAALLVRLDALLVQLENRLDLMARRDLAQRLPLVN